MSLTLALHRGAQQKPHGTFSVYEDRAVTFAETRERVSRIAGGLLQTGLQSGERVAILSLNSDAYMQSVLAVAWADAVFVPVNTRWSLSEIADSLIESGTRILIVDEAFIDLGERLVAQVACISTLVCTSSRRSDGMVSLEELATIGPQVADAHRRGQSLAGIFYTGGTTGRSRGAMISHAALVASASAFAVMQHIRPDDVSLAVAPLFHLAQFSGWVASCLVGSSTVALPTFDPPAIMRQIARHQVSRAVLVPTMLHALVTHPEAEQHDLASLRTIVYGGSPISQITMDRTRELLPCVRFAQVYGMTEMAAVATVLTAEDHDDVGLKTSAGRAAPQTLLRITDPATGDELPAGNVGEVVVMGGGLMLGYWERPEETEAVLRGGWLHTGDAGYVDGRGYLFVVDRLKDMIVSGGENVYSVEVENVIDKHPAVAQSVVIGLPDDTWVERVHAVVLLRAGATLELQELQRHCRSEIAGYKCPRGLTVVDALPTSGAGKILKRDLRASLTTSAGTP